MKKSFNKLLIITLIGFIVVGIFCYLSVMFGNFNLFTITKYIINEDPTTAIIAPFTILADIAILMALGFIYLIIPLSALFSALIFQSLARLFQIGENKKWKNVVSNVFTIISMVILFVLCIYIGIVFLFKLNLFMLLASIALIIEIKLFLKEYKVIKDIKK